MVYIILRDFMENIWTSICIFVWNNCSETINIFNCSFLFYWEQDDWKVERRAGA